MANDLVDMAIQDPLLSECYENINNRKYVVLSISMIHLTSEIRRYCGRFVNSKNIEFDETFRLLHVIHDFESNDTAWETALESVTF